MTKQTVRTGLGILALGIVASLGHPEAVRAAQCSAVAGWAHNDDTGYTVVTCEDGRQGFGYLAGAHPDFLAQEAEEFCCPGEL